ncbi:MAG: phospho-N-acetylmuramoyl-pentapeptide-transferase [Solobacterium sp.]|nr:phospho-N-acetylmuramoyl-pentapeptide-transferase [Solobacterium sp.]
MALNCLLSFLVSLAAVWTLMPGLIRYMKKISFSQTVSEYSLEEYREKGKTPIMGGILFIVVPLIVSLISELFVGFSNDLLILQITFFGYGLIGFLDDWLIAVRHNNEGLLPRWKFLLQVLLALIIFFIYRGNGGELTLRIPFAHTALNLGPLYLVLILLMFSGASNAVNLTDGMDGLAAGCCVSSFAVFLILAVRDGNVQLAGFFSALIGALIGFLHYNVHPAKIFMGDTGALALGGALAAASLVMKQEIALIVIGGVYVLDTLSCIIQIGSVKLRNKRVFPYTPIHYTFVLSKEKKGLGLQEAQTVHIIWLASAVFAVLGLIVALN